MTQDLGPRSATVTTPKDARAAEVLRGLVGILREDLGVVVDGAPGPQTFESLDIDSLSMVEFVVAVEELFGVRVGDKDTRDLAQGTLDDAVGLILRKQGNPTGPVVA
ncbi:acyl carrier protein [Kitasatospora sp. NPDC101176]|uniref:acyl carrier protein n=1 Tax=Kitasatospora sp. NPDC101176 TaxID=3364099 RepID=UPI00382AAD0F